MKLLSIEQDAKTSKSRKLGYLTGIVYLAPSTEADGVHNLCPMATAECREACLYGAGMAGVFPSIKRTRIERTLFYLHNPEAFIAQLSAEIHALVKSAKRQGLKPAVRINGTSDLPKLAHQLVYRFPDVQFYDYTKIPKPWKRTETNYHLTFSFSGSNLHDAIDALAQGHNVAVVFEGKTLPSHWYDIPVIDGDEHDLRFLDPKGVIVGLRAKGDARKMTAGGFIQIGAAA